ncbi:hypothetical protein AVEN_160285-1 [Araneus ventricosus]|uniref:Uncharacterized protein n=1 Tax=Araneus ventricosus TaxID=182803 RepID=A0A4Y2UA29_ARAVE|nr:hypothetical protein AVEN_160285-1 [Araneus ventricosus]
MVRRRATDGNWGPIRMRGRHIEGESITDSDTDTPGIWLGGVTFPQVNNGKASLTGKPKTHAFNKPANQRGARVRRRAGECNSLNFKDAEDETQAVGGTNYF